MSHLSRKYFERYGLLLYSPNIIRTLRWRYRYLLPLFVIPVVLPVVQLVLVVRKNASQPSDNIHCDVTGPNLW